MDLIDHIPGYNYLSTDPEAVVIATEEREGNELDGLSTSKELAKASLLSYGAHN
jgi:hypothetical protein